MNIINIRIELQINDILDKTTQYMISLSDIDAKKKILFDVMRIFNSEQARFYENMYEDLTESEKKQFIDSTICNGIMIYIGEYDEIKLNGMIRDVNEKFGDIFNKDESNQII